MFVSALKMKKTGTPSSLLLEPDEVHRCKDIKGMTIAAAGKMLIFGLVTVVCGNIGTVNAFLLKIQWLGVTELCVFLMICLWFVSGLHRVRDEFMK